MLTKENKSCHGLCEQITHLCAALNWLAGQGASKAGTFPIKLSWMLAWHCLVDTGAALLSALATRVMLPGTLVSAVMSDGMALAKAKLRGTCHQMATRLWGYMLTSPTSSAGWLPCRASKQQEMLSTKY